MDLWEAIVIAFRRWYVVIPTLAVGLILGQVVANSVKPVYRADATVQYRQPAIDQTDEEAVLAVAGNPYTIVTTLITATEVASQGDLLAIEMREQGFGDVAYSISSDRRDPLLVIQVEATRPADAVGAVEALVAYVQRDAVERQTQAIGDTPDYFVDIEILDQALVAQTDLTSRTRTRVLMAAVAIVFAIVGAVGVESLISHLRRRREGDDSEAQVDEQPGVVWFGLPVSAGQTVPTPPQQLTAISGGSDWREERIRDAANAAEADGNDNLRPTGSEKRRTRWAR
jgi:hypothetical protein